MLDRFKKLIKNIIWDVMLRLVEDAVKEGLINGSGQAKLKKAKWYLNDSDLLKSYPEAKCKYDEIVSAIAEYFDLFKQNSDRLEDLWL